MSVRTLRWQLWYRVLWPQLRFQNYGQLSYCFINIPRFCNASRCFWYSCRGWIRTVTNSSPSCVAVIWHHTTSQGRSLNLLLYGGFRQRLHLRWCVEHKVCHRTVNRRFRLCILVSSSRRYFEVWYGNLEGFKRKITSFVIHVHCSFFFFFRIFAGKRFSVLKR